MVQLMSINFMNIPYSLVNIPYPVYFIPIFDFAMLIFHMVIKLQTYWN